MNNITNISLKYLVIIVVSVSVLMIIGAIIFSLINKNKPSSSPLPSPSKTEHSQPATPIKTQPVFSSSSGGGGGGHE